jgi:hypothetical protein
MVMWFSYYTLIYDFSNSQDYSEKMNLLICINNTLGKSQIFVCFDTQVLAFILVKLVVLDKVAAFLLFSLNCGLEYTSSTKKSVSD